MNEITDSPLDVLRHLPLCGRGGAALSVEIWGIVLRYTITSSALSPLLLKMKRLYSAGDIRAFQVARGK
jgi:hypothetical protein